MSAPLGLICTDWDGVNRVHNFLCKYDPFNVLKDAREVQGTGGEIQDPYGAFEESGFSFGDDDDEDDGDFKYRKIQEFKSISDQLSAAYSPSEKIPREQTPHVSKYDKMKPKLKSNTRLYALPRHFECNGTPNREFCSTHRARKQGPRSTALHSTSAEADVMDFDYLSFLKGSQKLAAIAVEKREKKVADRLLALKNIALASSDSAERVEISPETVLEQAVQSPYRSLITSALSSLGSGLVERDVEVTPLSVKSAQCCFASIS